MAESGGRETREGAAEEMDGRWRPVVCRQVRIWVGRVGREKDPPGKLREELKGAKVGAS